MNIRIRHEEAADASAIESLIVAAFADAPHTEHNEQFIVRALREAGALSLSLVAEEAGSLLGHVAVSPVTISGTSAHWFGLGPISVLPQYQGKGIGSQLMEAALTELKMREAAGCVLLGDPAFYERFGFRVEPELELPDVPPEYFQVLAFAAPAPRGVVAYHNAFAAGD